MLALDMDAIAPGLTRGDDGIWRGTAPAFVSYAEQGNEDCFQIEDGSFWFLHRNRCIVKLVERHPPRGTILDLGGGNGFVAMALLRAGFPTAVLEVGAIGAAHARQRGVDPVICSTLEGARFVEGSIPAVGMFDVLEHIEDDRAALENCRRLLVPGGELYLTVPAMSWLWSRNDVHAGHHRRYTLRSLRRLLDSTGFEILWDSCFFRCLVPAIFVGRTLKSALLPARERHLVDKQRDHVRESRSSQRWIQTLLDREYARIQAGRSTSLGSSCLVAARATHANPSDGVAAVRAPALER